MVILILLILLIVLAIFISYWYFKMTINEIYKWLVILDKIFEERYNSLTKAILPFQKYFPEQKNLIFEIQKSKAEAAKFAKPKSADELAQKIMNENILTININYFLDKCNFNDLNPLCEDVIKQQADYIVQINSVAEKYNKLILNYKALKNIFPFNCYTKIIGIDLNLDTIKTE